MNQEEFERALAEVAERLDLYLDEQVEARLEAEEDERRRGARPPSLSWEHGWGSPTALGPGYRETTAQNAIMCEPLQDRPVDVR